MKVLISGTEYSNFFIELLDEIELFIDKKVIFDDAAYFVICITFFPLNQDISPFQFKLFWFSEINLNPIVF
jgi:hypothetical protein